MKKIIPDLLKNKKEPSKKTKKNKEDQASNLGLPWFGR
jgi:hypothetical protein